jgi:folate-dependent phosphoribosylglycinamide formyltransferase PurN
MISNFQPLMQQKKIIFLASDCESSRWVYNALKKKFDLIAAVIEQPVSKKSLIKGRIKKIGFLRVSGQVLFSAVVVPFLKIKTKSRKAALLHDFGLEGADFEADKTYRVSSVNSDDCLNILQQVQPDIVVVNGTRIISKKILQSMNAVFINMHAGITPMYRGSHGGYWALFNKDSENFGTTIHLVDAGIDTGAIIKQAFIKPDKKDNFTTYPVLQTAVGITALTESLTMILLGEMNTTSPDKKGKLYHQPTIWEYLSRTIP